MMSLDDLNCKWKVVEIPYPKGVIYLDHQQQLRSSHRTAHDYGAPRNNFSDAPAICLSQQAKGFPMIQANATVERAVLNMSMQNKSWSQFGSHSSETDR